MKADYLPKKVITLDLTHLRPGSPGYLVITNPSRHPRAAIPDDAAVPLVYALFLPNAIFLAAEFR